MKTSTPENYIKEFNALLRDRRCERRGPVRLAPLEFLSAG